MKSFSYIIFISVLFGCLGQVASDLYLPSLPAISISFNVSAASVQMTVAAYMFGYALSFLFYGPISDAIGRKIPLIGGLIIFLLGTLGCVLTNSIDLLIAARLLQGFGAGSGVILGNTIIRDLSDEHNLAKAYSYLGVANIVAIASAPFFGGYLQQFFGWRANFIVLLIYSLLALSISIFCLSETNQHRTIANLHLKQIRLNLSTLFSNSQFVLSIVSIFMVYGAILAWLTLGPIFLQNTLGISPADFGTIALVGGVFYAAGAFINGKLINKFDAHNMLIFAAGLSIFSGIAILLLYLLFPHSTLAIVLPVFGFLFCTGIIFPNAYAGALKSFAKIAGFAGAIVGFVQISGGALSSGIMSLLPKTTVAPIALAIILSGACVFTASLKTKFKR
ncbi:MAG: multidrug effflux MFS transporter [Gammaproteobacteria bacterium]|nr:multidrug effflux MFS transporter [Gammaproteobacteria bacterium]